MEFTYKTRGTCSSQIRMDIEGDVITNVRFTGGCNGNLKAVSSLVDGLTVAQIRKKCEGIQCGMKGTSCADQLSKAVQAAYEAECAAAN